MNLVVHVYVSYRMCGVNALVPGLSPVGGALSPFKGALCGLLVSVNDTQQTIVCANTDASMVKRSQLHAVGDCRAPPSMSLWGSLDTRCCHTDGVLCPPGWRCLGYPRVRAHGVL